MPAMPVAPATTATSPIAVPSRRLYTESEIHPVANLLDLLLLIMDEKRTGSIQVNFAGGKPDGTVEWKSRYTPPEPFLG